jgi:hypothetical protein
MTYEEKLRIFLYYIGEMMLTGSWDFRYLRNVGLIESLFRRKKEAPAWSLDKFAPDHPDIPHVSGDWWVNRDMDLSLHDLNWAIFGLGQRGTEHNYETAKGFCDPFKYEMEQYIDVSEHIDLSDFTHVTKRPVRGDPSDLYDFPIFGAHLSFVSDGAPDYLEKFSVEAEVEISFPGDYHEFRGRRDKVAHLKLTDVHTFGPKDALSKCVDTEFQYNDRRGNTLSEIGSSVKDRMKLE